MKNIADDSERLAPACQKALGDTSKALKAFAFYPENHPLRRQIFDSAYQSMAALAAMGRISLIVQRGGFAIAGSQSVIETNPMTKALAQELFARELQRITIQPELSLADFSALLSILAVAPQKIAEEGGVGEMLAKAGVTTVTVNQIDVTAVFTKKTAGQPEQDATEEGAVGDEEREPEPEPETVTAQSGAAPQAEPGIDQILAALADEKDESRYRQLTRLLLKKALPLKLEGNFDRLYVVFLRLIPQLADPARSAACREAALEVLEQLCLGEMAEHLLDHLEDVDFPQKEEICRILKLGGGGVAEAIARRLAATGSRASRKALGTALVRMGTAAQPQVLPLLKDGRIAVVQMAVAILGEIGTRDAVRALTVTLQHPDQRVRMESIRSLARIGGMEATGVVLSLIQAEDEAAAVQAITWLGNCRNHAALEPLLQLVARRDLMGKLQVLKKEALRAIGRIGDRRALDPLFRLVRRRHLIAPARRLEQKLSAIEAIAALGGEQARVFLQEISAGGGELARPAQVVLEAMQHRGDEHE
ncbi:HEAT repeat domain-containing protein [Geomonas terrae]|nr:HEAT repeat domain-containing protein [Geomonas terrae]